MKKALFVTWNMVQFLTFLAFLKFLGMLIIYIL